MRNQNTSKSQLLHHFKDKFITKMYYILLKLINSYCWKRSSEKVETSDNCFAREPAKQKECTSGQGAKKLRNNVFKFSS